jgi:hypothetical protein
LSNGDEDGLMVSGRVDRGQFVGSSREPGSNISSEDTVDSCRVQALEECKLGRVRRCGRIQRIDRFDDNVGVADDLTLTVHLLGRGEIVLLGVYKVTGFKVVDGHRDCESLVRWDSAKVLRERKFGGWDVLTRGNDTHRGGIA